MPERDYSHRSAVEKLGIKPGQAVALVHHAFQLDSELCRDILVVTGRSEATPDEPCATVLIGIDSTTDAAAVLRQWRSRIRTNGGIWLLTPKRGLPGYVDQRDLIVAGMESELVDNKTCSVSAAISGMRFVVRLTDRSTQVI